MDVVIPLGNESKHQNLELKYCLRSIEKNLLNYNNIFVIGEVPSVRNITHIYQPEIKNPLFRNKNIYNKILVACNNEDVSNPFLLVYDDYIFLQPILTSAIPYYQHGIISAEGWNSTQNYYHTLTNTIRLLGDVPNFDSHAPIIIWKEVFKKINVDWQKPHGYCLKTIYCNLAGIKGTHHKDFKIKKTISKQELLDLAKNESFISLPSGVLKKDLLETLIELFPLISH